MTAYDPKRTLAGKLVWAMAQRPLVLDRRFHSALENLPSGSLRIGAMVMKNVTVRIAEAKNSLLMGQKFLSRLRF